MKTEALILAQRKEYNKEYREANKDKLKEYYKNNKDKILTQQKQYRETTKIK